MTHSLNDIARFWFAVCHHTDLIDDPKGLDHPLLDHARRFGITLNQLCDFCRYVNETRAKNANKPVEQDRVSGALDFEGFNALQQGLVHQNLQNVSAANIAAGNVAILNNPALRQIMPTPANTVESEPPQ